MKPDFRLAADNPMLMDFVESASGSIRPMNTAISQSDEMFYKAIVPGYAAIEDAYMAYLQSGKRMLDVIQQIARHGFGDLKNVRSFLEFACGYGRFTRHLVSHIPGNQVVVSDIYREAVDWQRQRHGVIGVYSTPSPRDFALSASFDIIFVGSLFSHLPKDLFESWLSRLYSMLSDVGIIVFSVHDIHLLQGNTAEGDVFVYNRASESDSLSHDIYGMTYVSESYVESVISSFLPGKRTFKKFFKGLYENQDLYILPKQKSDLWNNFDLVPTPIGGRTWFRSIPGGFGACGWALSLHPDFSLNEGALIAGQKNIGKITTTPDESDEIVKFFPGVRTPPVRFQVEYTANDIAPGTVVKARFYAHPDYSFDVYLGVV